MSSSFYLANFIEHNWFQPSHFSTLNAFNLFLNDSRHDQEPTQFTARQGNFCSLVMAQKADFIGISWWPCPLLLIDGGGGGRARGQPPSRLLTALHAALPLATEWRRGPGVGWDKGAATILAAQAALCASTSQCLPILNRLQRSEDHWLHQGANILFLSLFG